MNTLLEVVLWLERQHKLTIDQNAIREGVHGPDVGCPVSVAKASREWEQPLQDLWNLFIVDERSECKSCNKANAQAKFDAVEDLNMEDRARPKAVRSQ